jgi:hypothetical protein
MGHMAWTRNFVAESNWSFEYVHSFARAKFR